MDNKKINLITQFNGFNSFITFKHPLSNNAIALYFRLLDLWNKSNWEYWIPLSQSKLMDISNALSKNTAYKTRNELKEFGLIDFTKGKKGQLPYYHIFELTSNGEFVPEEENYTENDSDIGSELSSNFKPNNEKDDKSGLKIKPNNEPISESGLKIKPNTEPINDISPVCWSNFKPNTEPIFDEELFPSLDNYNTSIINKTKLNKTKLDVFNNNNNLSAKVYSSPKKDSPPLHELEIVNTRNDDSETKTISAKPNDNKPELDKKAIQDFYNDNRRFMPKIIKMTDTRYKAVKARVKEYSLDTVKQVIVKAAESNFLNGDNERNWTADFDWLMKPSNFIKVLEGRYDNKEHFRKNNKKRDMFDNPLWREAFGNEMPLEGTLF